MIIKKKKDMVIVDGIILKILFVMLIYESNVRV